VIRPTLGLVSVITLTTDFGTHDWFVGTLKGVIAVIAPKARVIDLTHDLPPGDIRGGAGTVVGHRDAVGQVVPGNDGVGLRRHAQRQIRARAFAATGDYMDEEPFCVYQPQSKVLKKENCIAPAEVAR